MPLTPPAKSRFPVLSCVFRLGLSLVICHQRTALRQENSQPTGVHVHLHLRYTDALSHRWLSHRSGRRLIAEDTVSSQRGHIGEVRPCQENTARHVFMIAASTRSAGSSPAPTGMNPAGAPSVIRVGAPSLVRPVASARQASGTSAAGSIGSPEATASRCVHDRGTTCTSWYPPPPVSSHLPPATSCASSCTMSWARRWPSTLSSRLASGSSRWLSQPCWLTSTSGLNARNSGGTTASNARSQPASPVNAGSATLTA